MKSGDSNLGTEAFIKTFTPAKAAVDIQGEIGAFIIREADGSYKAGMTQVVAMRAEIEGNDSRASSSKASWA